MLADHKTDAFVVAISHELENAIVPLYSLFWGSNGMDLAVISSAGTTEELWKTYSPTFNKMGEFELIDMKRFEK